MSFTLVSECEEMSTPDNTPNVIEPVKKVSRKKRLEMPAVGLMKVAKTSKSNHIVDQTEEKALESSSKAGYNEVWSYNSELRGGEHCGFGYNCIGGDHKAATPKVGMIQFIKADTLMPKDEPIKDVSPLEEHKGNKGKLKILSTRLINHGFEIQ